MSQFVAVDYTSQPQQVVFVQDTQGQPQDMLTTVPVMQEQAPQQMVVMQHVKSAQPQTLLVQQAPDQEPVYLVEQQPQYVEVQPVQQPVQYVEVVEQPVVQLVQVVEDPFLSDVEYQEETYDAVTVSQKEPVPVITGDKLAQKANHKAKVVRSSFKVTKNAPKRSEPPTKTKEDGESPENWMNMRSQIDRQYEKKLKEVGDNAIKKLKMFQAEHKALLEKTEYLLERSTLEDPNYDDLEFEQKQWPATTKKLNQKEMRDFNEQVRDQLDREDQEYRKSINLKNKSPGATVLRQSQQKPKVVKSNPPQYVEQSVQYVQQPVYSQPVQVIQQPVRYVVQQQQQPQPQPQPQRRYTEQPAVYHSQSFIDQNEPGQTIPNAPLYDTFSEPSSRIQQRKSELKYTAAQQSPVRKSAFERPRSVHAFTKDQSNAMRDRSAKRQNAPKWGYAQPQLKSKQPTSTLPPQDREEEPICVLKVELEGGQNVQLLKVYFGQIPEEVVEEFGEVYKISENSKHKLLKRIYEQMQL